MKYLKPQFILLFFLLPFFLIAQNNPSPFIGINHPRGENLLVLRLAVSCNAEYTQQVGGVTNAATNIAAWLIEINKIYGREHCIRFELIANNNSLIFTDSATDPWPTLPEGSGGCTNAGLILDIQANVIDGLIGAENYDFSHVMAGAPFGGGCAGSYKGGLSGQLDLPVTRHEMGHQFQQPHTISNGGNNNFELNGGNWTMMGGNGQPYAHASSFHQTVNHITTTEAGVGTNIPTGNTVPTVNAGPDVVIPISTPFVLTGTASDPDAGDSLTYVWDSMDRGIGQGSPVTDDTQGALFMRLLPTVNANRTIPKIEDVINNLKNTATENLPSQPREMNIRFTVNDNHKFNYNGDIVNASGSLSDDIKITVVNNGGPFQVTSPNTAVAYTGGTSQTITWDVNGTNLAPISTANVKISLSTDGGFTFPIVLANSTANDGTELLVMPNITTSQARIKIEAIGNIYFDMSNENFSINQNTTIAGISTTISGANTQVSEHGQTDTYTVALLTNPTGSVTVTLTADAQTEVSIDGLTFGATQTIILNNTTPQTITVSGKFDTTLEGPHLGTISQVVTATLDAGNYPVGLPGAPVTANISDAQVPPVVGIDFDVASSTSVPTNWVRFSQVDGQTASDIPLDDGTPTNIDVTMTADLCGRGGCILNFGDNTNVNNSPQHVQELAETIEGISISRGTVRIVWSDLNPNTAYRIYVFTSFILGGTSEQTVTITGNGTDNPAPFLQTIGGSLLINDEISNNQPLLNFGKTVTSTSTGTITISITGPDELWISGLAIQEVLSAPASCLAADITLTTAQNTAADFETNGSIFSTQIIGNNATVDYDAQTAISLNTGFHAQQGVTFHAFIDGCGNLLQESGEVVAARTKNGHSENKLMPVNTSLADFQTYSTIDFADYNCTLLPSKKENIPIAPPHLKRISDLVVYPNPTSQTIQIDYRISQKQSVVLYLMDFSGRIVQRIEHNHQEKGKYQTVLDFQEAFAPGLYQMVLQTAEGVYTQKVIYQR